MFCRLFFFFLEHHQRTVIDNLKSSSKIKSKQTNSNVATIVTKPPQIKVSVVEPTRAATHAKRNSSSSLPDATLPRPPADFATRKSFPATGRRGKFQYRSGRKILLYLSCILHVWYI